LRLSPTASILSTSFTNQGAIMRLNTSVVRLALCVAAIGLAACGDDGGGASDGGMDGGTDTDADTDADSDTDADVTLAGELVLLESSSLGYQGSSFKGVIGEGGFRVWQQETMTEGDCRLLEFVPASCEEFCDGVCVGENVCEPWPTYADAGTLTVTGAATGVAAEPGDFGFSGKNYYYWSSAVTDLFGDGDPITATFEGGEPPGLTVSAAGVEPLVLTSVADDEIALPNGQDTAFEWVAGSGGARVRVTLNANSSGGHGSPYEAIIVCDAADTGSLIIPRALVEAFPETYRWEACAGKDCPLSTAVRYRRGYTEIAGGAVELRVGSSVEFFIVHDLP
jgi:hypothetical protein